MGRRPIDGLVEFYRIRGLLDASPGMSWMAAYREVFGLPQAKTTDRAVERRRRRYRVLKKSGRLPDSDPLEAEQDAAIDQAYSRREENRRAWEQDLRRAEAEARRLGVDASAPTDELQAQLSTLSRQLDEATPYLRGSDVAILRLMKEHATAEDAKAALRAIKAAAKKDELTGKAVARIVELRLALEAMR